MRACAAIIPVLLSSVWRAVDAMCADADSSISSMIMFIVCSYMSLPRFVSFPIDKTNYFIFSFLAWNRLFVLPFGYSFVVESMQKTKSSCNNPILPWLGVWISACLANNFWIVHSWYQLEESIERNLWILDKISISPLAACDAAIANALHSHYLLECVCRYFAFASSFQ